MGKRAKEAKRRRKEGLGFLQLPSLKQVAQEVATLHPKVQLINDKKKNRARMQCISAIISAPHHSARRKEGKGKEEEKNARR